MTVTLADYRLESFKTEVQQSGRGTGRFITQYVPVEVETGRRLHVLSGGKAYATRQIARLVEYGGFENLPEQVQQRELKEAHARRQAAEREAMEQRASDAWDR